MNTYIKGRISKGEFVSELFKQRVESLGGTYEANDCLVDSLNSLTDREFKDAKAILTPNGYLVDKLPTIKPNGGGDSTVTRNTTKTRANSSGLIESMVANVLAPDYLNGGCPALNVEGQSTNLFQYSDQFDNAYWQKNQVSIITDQTIAPTNQFEGERVTSTIDAHSRINSPTINFNLNKDYVASFYVRNSTTNKFTIGIRRNSTFLRGVFDLNNLTVDLSNSGSIVKSGKVVEAQLGWYRCSVVINVPTTEVNDYIYINNAPDGFITSLGDRYDVWGAQIEEGTEPTSYIPTTTAQVTRSADTVTIPIPAGTTEIIEKYEDGTTNTITTIPASPYTVPTGKRYEYILMR